MTRDELLRNILAWDYGEDFPPTYGNVAKVISEAGCVLMSLQERADMCNHNFETGKTLAHRRCAEIVRRFRSEFTDPDSDRLREAIAADIEADE